MPQMNRIVGTSGGFGITRDLWPEGDSYVQVVIQADSGVGDDELNLMQQIAEMNLRRLGHGLLTDGMMDKGVFTTPGTPANTFYLNENFFLVGGMPFFVADSRNNTAPLAHAVAVALNAPPGGSVNRVDLVFLEVWFEEVASTGQANASVTDYERGGVGNLVRTNTILNTYLNTETARRVQLRWRVRVVDNATTVAGQTAWGGVVNNVSGRTFSLVETGDVLHRAGNLDGAEPAYAKGTTGDAAIFHSVNGFVYALPLFTVLRRPGDTGVLATDLATTPPRCRLKALVPQENIDPPIVTGEDIFPVTLLYDGVAGFAQNGSSITENRLDTQSLAAQVIIPRPSGSPVNTVSLARATIRLARRGSATTPVGADLLVELVADAGGQPNGAVVASFWLPKEWLTAEVRDISIPLAAAVTYGSTYWIRITKAGDGTNYVAWFGEPSSNPDRTHAKATAGAVSGAWGTTMPPLYVSIYTGDDGGIRHVLEGSPPVAVTLMESVGDDLHYTGELTLSAAGTIASAELIVVGRDSGGAITSLVRVNPG